MPKQLPALVINRRGEVWNSNGKIVASKETSKQFMNSLGAEQSITTLTSILPEIISQKFYDVALQDFIDIEVGRGNPFSSELMNWATGITGDDFESGLMSLASNGSNANSDNMQLEPIKRQVTSWRKNVTYNTIQEGTLNAGTQRLSYIESLYSARKKEYDLGFQKMVFFGLSTKIGDFRGLLNQATVASNTTLITKYLKDMTAAEFNAVIAGLIPAYMSQSNYTAKPNTFIIPAIDFYGLTTQMSETYPLRTKLSVLKEALEQATGNGNFKIEPLAYADEVRNNGITGLSKNRYVLYNKAPDSLILDVPLDFTVTLPGTINGFDYTSSAYARFTGAQALRPLEMLYFDFTNPTT